MHRQKEFLTVPSVLQELTITENVSIKKTKWMPTMLQHGVGAVPQLKITARCYARRTTELKETNKKNARGVFTVFFIYSLFLLSMIKNSQNI